MKAIILAGGRGTRLSEETETIPKPMIEIGGRPILWHIMKIYSHYGINDFIICLGYKGYVIKEYFSHYFLHMSDVTISMATNKIKVHTSTTEPWKITLVDTGSETMTGGRIKRLQRYIGNEKFMLTYGDGVSNIDINKLIKFYNKKRFPALVTAVQPIGRFGSLDLDTSGKVNSFLEKPESNNSWINAGFFVLGPEIFKYIKDDGTSWEKESLENLALDGKLAAYKHTGFWKSMDTLRDKIELERLWQTGKAPWKIWK